MGAGCIFGRGNTQPKTEGSAKHERESGLRTNLKEAGGMEKEDGICCLGLGV